MIPTRTVTVAAGDTFYINQRGRVFAVVDATAAFAARFDSEAEITLQAGRVRGSSTSNSFRTVQLRNTGASSNDITFYLGDEDFKIESVISSAVVITNPSANTIVAPAEGIYLLTGAGVEAITADATLYFQRIFIHPAKEVSAGVLTANAADIYIGRSATHLPFLKTPTDIDVPVYYEVPFGQKQRLNTINVKGTAGDGVFYSYL